MKILGLITLCALSSGVAQVTNYQQNFEAGVIPTGWSTWHAGRFLSVWNYSPAIDGQFSLAITNAPGFDIGAWYQLAQPLNDLTVSFSFKCPAYPTEYADELIDLYDDAGNEVCDVYLSTIGQLFLTIGGSFGTVSKPIPVNKTVRIELHYTVGTTPSSARVTWSAPNSFYGGELNGAYRVDGQYSSPVTRFLLGPVDDVLFVYDDFVVTIPK